MGSWFSELLIRDVPGTVPEQVRTCGFRIISKSFYKAPEVHDSVRLVFWDSFLVTLPSISSDIRVMYFSVIPETNVFCDWLFLAFFCVSLDTAANFLLSLSVSKMRKREKLNSFEHWIRIFWITVKVSSEMQSPFSECKSFNQYQQVLLRQNSFYVTKIYNLHKNKNSFVSFIWTFSLAGNKSVYKLILGTKREKYFYQFIYKKMRTPAENKHFCVHFFVTRPRLLHLLTESVGV